MAAPEEDYLQFDPEYDLTAEEADLCAGDVAAIAEEHQRLRCKASENGKALLKAWGAVRKADIVRIKALFDPEGHYNELVPATAFNDLYKWTMAPVIRKLETFKDGEVQVTFGIDLRDKPMRDALRASREKKIADKAAGVVMNKAYLAADLETRIWNALKGLESRPFNRAVFTAPLKGGRAAILDEASVDAIVGAGTLVDTDGVKPLGTKHEHPFADKSVSISFYYNADAIYKDGEAPGIHFIEATGPWHRVSWLETSLMQAVYEAKLRFDLAAAGKTYTQWLNGALLRCAKSVAYTHLIQAKWPAVKPALFTGRRTGGLLFLLLQNLFFADHFTQAGPAYWDASFGNVDRIARRPDVPANLSLGSSSCDSWYILTQKLGLPCLNPAGTHAHELSMVTSALFPQLDQPSVNNPQGLPITQVIGHYLYWKLVQNKTGGPMPMLPDTLGTRAFMKAANYVTIPGEGGAPVPFLSVINSARQDSGDLSDFASNMAEFGYALGEKVGGIPRGMMASEIDTTAKLLKAAALNYGSFGAGGFFGDSEKVWGRNASSNSMAVKAVRVRWAGAPIPEISYIQAHPEGGVVGYPIKIGDPDKKDAPELGGKLSLDKNLPPAVLGPIVEYARTIYVRYLDGSLQGTKPLAELFDEGSPNRMRGGRRATRKMNGGRRPNKIKRATRSNKKRSTRRRRY